MLKPLIKKVFNTLDLEIKRNAPLLGQEDCFDIQKKLLNKSNSVVIFDVGAYTGETAIHYNNLFPKSQIYSFEPFPSSFSSLKENTTNYENIKIYNKGLGAYSGKSSFHSNGFAPTNSILATDSGAGSTWENQDIMKTKNVIDIDLTTIDSIVEEEGIEKIDILKMDVQGAEHLVIEGAKRTIEKGLIDIVYAEIITMPSYKDQKRLDEIIEVYLSNGFELFNFYNYNYTKSGQLRYMDGIFINSKAKFSI